MIPSVDSFVRFGQQYVHLLHGEECADACRCHKCNRTRYTACLLRMEAGFLDPLCRNLSDHCLGYSMLSSLSCDASCRDPSHSIEALVCRFVNCAGVAGVRAVWENLMISLPVPAGVLRDMEAVEVLWPVSFIQECAVHLSIGTVDLSSARDCQAVDQWHRLRQLCTAKTMQHRWSMLKQAWLSVVVRGGKCSGIT